MFRSRNSVFEVSEETRERLSLSRQVSGASEKLALSRQVSGAPESVGGEDSPTGGSPTRARLGVAGMHLLKCAKDYQAQTDWSGFAPGPPQIATKHMYRVDTGEWVEEEVLVEIDKEPFGRGAIRECFRMREVHMADHSADPSPVHSPPDHSPSDSPRARTYSSESLGKRNACDLLAAVAQIHDSKHRRCWVAKRSMSERDPVKHRMDCLADAALQQMAKHYAELFDAAAHPIKQEASQTCGFHDIDFLMAHVIELADGSTYGVEAFVFGPYEKYNNNSGQVTKPVEVVTPQSFSYFTFVQSGYRLMIVDIQGVDTLYTDPVIHLLPAHNPSLVALGDQNVNLGIRGMALFLWSHRNNKLDRLLNLPAFQHAPSEEGQHGGIAGLTVAQLATRVGGAKETDAPKAAAGTGAAVKLANVPGIDLSPQAWASVSVTVSDEAFPLAMVPAACHMEIAVMYHQGRLGSHAGNLTEAETEAAVFHVVAAAKEGLPEAVTALSRLCSGMSHDDFLPGVQCGPEHGELCLLLLGKLVEAAGALTGVPEWAQAARGALAGLLDTGAMGARSAAAAAEHYEAFGEAAVNEMEGSNDSDSASKGHALGLEVSSVHGASFGWGNHGLEAHSAYARAAELYNGQTGSEAKAHARRLWEAASEIALEDPHLAKKAMHYMQLAEAVEDEEEEEGAPSQSKESEGTPSPSTATPAVSPAKESEGIPSPSTATPAVSPEPPAKAACSFVPLRVEVADTSGRPVREAEVAVWDLDSDTQISKAVLTDSDGVAKLLAPATHKNIGFRVLKDGFHSQEHTVETPAATP